MTRRPPSHHLGPFAALFGAAHLGAALLATACSSPPNGRMVEESQGRDQKFERREDGSGVLHLKVKKSPLTHQRLLHYLAAYSGQCAILKPAWLRRQAMAHLKEGAGVEGLKNALEALYDAIFEEPELASLV